MSKEQTPITAEAQKWLKERGSQYSSDIAICYHMEQYAQAKVLEALEKHYKEVEVLCRNAHLLGMKETLPGYPKPNDRDWETNSNI